MGSNYTRGGGQLYKIKNVIAHEKYTGVTDYDIALIRVAGKFIYSDTVQPIPLATEEPKDGEMVVVTGYGRQRPMKRSVIIFPTLISSSPKIHLTLQISLQTKLKNRLMAVTIPILNHKKCKTIFKRKKLAISKRMICAGYTDSRPEDACQGDSGGPLVLNKKLIGIVAWGIGCGRAGLPGVYMSIPKFLEWIEITKNKLYKEEI